jgi:HSP20 family protein
MYFTTIKPAIRRPLGFYHSKASTTPVSNKPLYNIIQKEAAWNLEIALPGFSKEEIQVDIQQDQLIIKATPTATENNVKTYHREFNLNEKSIQFHLNDNMDASAIQAKLENGILLVQIPSKTPAENSAVRIEVK